MKFRTMSLLVTAIALTGCATMTPYQPAAKRGAPGYTETQLGANRYRIVFTGNARTPEETVKDYALLRAAELTLQKGDDWFRIASRDNDTKTKSRTTVSPSVGFASVPQTAVYQRCGLLSCQSAVATSPGYGYGVGSDVTTTSSSSAYTSSLEILMGKGKQPNGVESYNARETANSLRGLMTSSAG